MCKRYILAENVTTHLVIYHLSHYGYKQDHTALWPFVMPLSEHRMSRMRILNTGRDLDLYQN